jgi:hypothetical protein
MVLPNGGSYDCLKRRNRKSWCQYSSLTLVLIQQLYLGIKKTNMEQVMVPLMVQNETHTEIEGHLLMT